MRCSKERLNKLLSTIILILLAARFQPAMGQVGIAGEALPFLVQANAQESENQAILQIVQKAGLGPQMVSEADFVAAMRLYKLPYLAVPLGNSINNATLTALTQYVAGGGKLLLLPNAPASQLVGNPVLELVGLPASGFRIVHEELKLNWKNQASPTAFIPKKSGILTLAPLNNATILAEWNNQYPAIVQTPKGILFNWQWVKQLSEQDYLTVLAQILPKISSMKVESAAQKTASDNNTTASNQTSTSPNVAVAPDQVPTTPAVMVLKQVSERQPSLPTDKPVELVATPAEPAKTSAETPKAVPETQAAKATETISNKPVEPQASEKVTSQTNTQPAESASQQTPIGSVATDKVPPVIAKPVEASHAVDPSKVEVQTTTSKPAEAIQNQPTSTTEAVKAPETSTKAVPTQVSGPSTPSTESNKSAVPSGTKVAIAPLEQETPKTASTEPTSTPVETPKAVIPEKVEEPAKKPDEAVIATQTATKPETAQPAKTEVAVITPSSTNAPAPAKATEPTSKEPIKTAVGDDEVLNNILGVPNTPPNSQTPTMGPASEPHKPFSFLDPEASSVLAPEFDYGVYSMNMRMLEDYKKRITDALETSKQLSLNMPQEQIANLLAESDAHKKRFGDLYLNNQTEAGLNELAQARRLSLQALALTTISPRVEGRAIWLDRGTVVKAGGPAGIKLLMQRMHQSGLNIVYFETLNAGFPMYQSNLLKGNPMVQGWDPLQVAVEEGHRLGMEVHAWVWVFAVGNRRHNDLINKPSSYPGPILEDGALMSEALRGRDGGLNMDPRQNEYWLSPASPKGRDFLVNVYKEIITRYPVDGLHLDYIRYPFQTGGTRMGFEPVGKERFTQSTGMNLDNMDDYTLRMWIAWKTYQVSSFVQQVSEMVRSTRPEVKISAAVFPMRRDARIVAIQQDWETWVDNGWIDMLNPMSYTSDPERLQSIYEYVQHSPQKHVLFYPGISLKHLDGASLVTQVEALRQKGCLGSTLFAGAFLDSEKIDTLGKGLYKEANSIPPHRNVVESLKRITADYDQKLSQLQANGGVTASDANNIHTALGQFSSSLNALQTGTDASKIQQAQQTLQTVQTITQNWTRQDKLVHPYRAAYFDTQVLQLNELVGYLLDKSMPPTTAESFAQFKKAIQPAAIPGSPTAATATTAEQDGDGTGQEQTENTAKPSAQKLPIHATPASQAAQPVPVTTAN